jgi:glutathione S-transferase
LNKEVRIRLELCVAPTCTVISIFASGHRFDVLMSCMPPVDVRYLEANPAGKVPALKNPDGWLADSDEITKLLEKDYPEPSLATPSEKASV